MPGVDRECVTHHACDCIQAKLDQQREDIQRLVVALEEWVDSFDGQKSETHGRMQRPALLAELKERYPKGDE